MRKLIVTLVAVALHLVFFSAEAQVPAGQSAYTTLFDDFKPGVVTLSTGRKVKQSKINIFLKNSTLVFRRGNQVMEAEMPSIKAVDIEGRTFINIGNILAEVVAADSLSDVQLLRVRTIDVDAMKAQALENSTVDNLGYSTAMSMLNVSRRMDVVEGEEPYLLMDTYYFVYRGKQVDATERSVKEAIGKKKRKELEFLVEYNFRWSDPQSLIRLFPLFKQ